jgi:ribonuclease-3
MSAASKDPKTELQEWLQAKKLKLPNYRVVSTKGAAHQQTFEVECEIAELNVSRRGEGESKRSGEQSAAKAMLEWLNKQPK